MSISALLYEFQPIRKATDDAREIVDSWMKYDLDCSEEHKEIIANQIASAGWPAAMMTDRIAEAILEAQGYDLEALNQLAFDDTLRGRQMSAIRDEVARQHTAVKEAHEKLVEAIYGPQEEIDG